MPLQGKRPNLIVISFSILVFCLLFFGFFAPTLLSTNFGQKVFARILSNQFSGKFTIEHLSLSWFNNQTIKGIEWSNPKEGLFLRCDQMTTTAPLWELFLHHHLGEMKMIAPHIELEADLSPPVPLSIQSYGRDTSINEAGFFPKISHKKQKFFGNIEIDKGTLLIFSQKKNLASFQQVAAQIYLPEHRFPIELALIGQTEQDGVTGKFDIKALLSSTSFFHPNCDVQAKLVHFPISGIDELFSFFDPSLKGFFVEAIGPSFDLELDAKFVPESQELHLLAQSSLLNAEIHAQSQNAVMTLQNPGKILFTMTPSFAEKFFGKFSSLKEISLKNSPEIIFDLHQLSLPLGFHFSDTALQSEIKISPAQLVSKQTNEPIFLESFTISLSSEQLQKGVKFASNGSLKMGNLSSALVLKGDIKNPFSSDILGTCKLHIQEFPVRLLEFLSNKNNQLIPLLGSSMRGLFTLDIHSTFTDLNFKASTPLLKISDAHFHINENVSLMRPVKAVYYPSHGIPLLAPMELSIEKCTFPRYSWEKLELDAHFQIPKITVYKQWILDELSGEITAHSLEDVQLQMLSPDLQFQTVLGFDYETKTLSLKKPLVIDYLLSPPKFHGFFQGETHAPLLVMPANFHLSAEPTTFSLKNLKTKVACSIDHLSLQIEDKTCSLEDIQLTIALDAPKETIEGVLKAGGKTLNIDAVAKSVKFEKEIDFAKTHLNLTLNMEDFPLAFFDSFTEQSIALAPILGPALNLSLQGTSSPDADSLSINATSSQLNVETAFTVKNNLFELSKPTKIDFLLNEKGYEILDTLVNGQAETPLELEKPSHFHLSVTNFLCPIVRKEKSRFSNFKFDFLKAYLTTHLVNDQCGFTQKQTGKGFSLEKLSFKFDRQDPNACISFDLTSHVFSKEKLGVKEGKIAIDGTIKDPIQIDQLTAQVHAKIQKTPSLLLDTFSRAFGRTDQPFYLFFGNALNAQFALDLKNFTGPIHLNIHSPNTRVAFSGAFDDGILTLKERVHAQMMVTPKLSALFLKEVNPFSITSIESMHPMTLEINPKGFSLPLSHSNWQKLMIPHARLELGQIYCKNEGNLNLTLGLLKQNTSPSSDLNLWFAPIEFRVNQNHCVIDRTEILINSNFEICTFGELDLEKEKLSMILGLTGQCLKKAFGINNLPPNYILQIPLKGAMDNVKLDTKKATGKITALLLWQKSALAAGSIGKESTGALLQDLIGKLATLPDKDKQAPSPKHPFPWEKETKASKADEPIIGKKCKIRKKEKPLKQLFKILS